MKIKPVLLIFLLGLTTFADTKDRRRKEQELEIQKTEALNKLSFLKKQLEKVRASRWQDKRNAIATQNAFNDSWKELKREVDRLSAQKTGKDESLLRWKNQKNEKKEAVDGMEARYRGFRNQLKEKIDHLENTIISSFEHDNQRHLDKLAHLRLELQGSGVGGVISSIDGIFGVWGKRFDIGESKSLIRGKLTITNPRELADANIKLKEKAAKELGTQVTAGYFIRIGAFYKTFISTESKDAALLVKTGRMGKRAWQWIENMNDETREDLLKSLSFILAGQRNEQNQNQPAYLPMDVQLVNATGEGYTTGSGTSTWVHFKKEFKEGGWVMYPILFLMLFGLLIIIERSVFFIYKDQKAAPLMKKVNRLVKENKIPEAKKLVSNRKKAVSRVVGVILDNYGKKRTYAEEQAYEVMLQETPKLETRISTINILAAASPLVGLLGTVSGMVTLFGVITVHGTSEPKLMAGGISEALIATKWGLGVAVPLLLIYNLIDLWSSKIISNMEKYSTQLLNEIYGAEKQGPSVSPLNQQNSVQPAV